MNIFNSFILGVFIAGILKGPWWFIAISGIFLLILRRSYFVLFAGLVLDMVFYTNGHVPFYFGFYTILFFSTTLIVEYLRSRLILTS